MTDLLYDAVARVARHEAAARSWATLAVVTEVHSSVLAGPDHAVTVQLRDSLVVVPRLPVAVGALGLAVTPAVGDLVLVVFADGDPHAGIVAGRLYHRDLAPPEHAAGQLVLQLPPASTSPDIDVLLEPATPEITVKVGETTVAITGKTATVTIGDTELLLDGNSPAKASLTCGDAKVVLDSSGDITLEATGKLQLKASEVTIEGSGSVKVSGGTVEVN